MSVGHPEKELGLSRKAQSLLSSACYFFLHLLCHLPDSSQFKFSVNMTPASSPALAFTWCPHLSHHLPSKCLSPGALVAVTDGM